MKTIQVAICGILILLAVACGKSETSSKAPTPVIPTNLHFEKPIEGPELTKAQVAEIRNYFGQKPMMTLPPGELVFPDANADPAELALKENLLRENDPNSADLLLNIRSACQKIGPRATVSAAFPLDGVTLGNVKAEDHVAYTASVGLAGSGCPSQFNAGTGTSVRVDEANNEIKYVKASGSSSAKLNAAITNEKYAKLLNARGVIVESKLSALATTTDLKNNNVHVTLDLSGTYLSLRAEHPYKMKIQYLERSNDLAFKSYEAFANTEVRFPLFTVHIDVRLIGNSKDPQPQVYEIYVNGRLMTPDQFEDLFGKSNPAGEPANHPVLDVLM